jgi:hypothetical protein
VIWRNLVVFQKWGNFLMLGSFFLELKGIASIKMIACRLWIWSLDVMEAFVIAYFSQMYVHVGVCGVALYGPRVIELFLSRLFLLASLRFMFFGFEGFIDFSYKNLWLMTIHCIPLFWFIYYGCINN